MSFQSPEASSRAFQPSSNPRTPFPPRTSPCPALNPTTDLFGRGDSFLMPDPR